MGERNSGCSGLISSACLAHTASSLCHRVQPEVKLKLSSAETYSKMRLKLVPNYNYDSHSDASAQRDNMGPWLYLTVFTSCWQHCKCALIFYGLFRRRQSSQF